MPVGLFPLIGLLPWAFASFLLPSPVFAASPADASCAFQAEIVDENGNGVTGASLTWIESGDTVVAGRSGSICLPELATGRHAFLVMGEGFSVLDAVLVKEEGRPLRATLELVPAFGEELVVTGTRTAKRLLDVPVHVQQISRAHIEAASARTLADAIELTPGVRIESNCQSCNFSQVRMMGLEGPYSQILVDGQPTVSSLAMVYGIEQFPARLLSGIEIVKGGGAAMYGGGAVGGVINLIPHSPMDTHATLEARSTRLGGEAGHSVSALMDWSPRRHRSGLSLMVQDDAVDPVDRNGDGLSEVSRRDLFTVALRGESYRLDDKARLSLEANLSRAARRGGFLLGIDRPPHETPLTEDITTRRSGLGLSWLHQVSSRWDYRVAGSFADTERDSYYGADFDPGAYGSTDNPLWVLDSQLNVYHGRGTVTAGAQYQRDELQDRQPGYGRSFADVYTNQALFVQEDRHLGAGTTVVYGARVDDHSELDEPVFSPRLALMSTLRSDLTLRLSAARGFRPPVVFDEDLHIELAGGAARFVEPDPELREETSTAYLASLEWRPSFGRKGSASFEVAWFQTELDDLFHVIENDDPSTATEELLRTNLGTARVAGLELSASLRWGSRFDAQLGFVQQRSRFGEPEPDFGSRDFFRTPERHGTLSLRVGLPRGLDLFVGGRYTGPMWAPHYAGFIAEDRLERTESFVELDLSLARTFRVSGQDLTVTVGAKNLTDAYQEDLDQGLDRDSNYVYGPRLPRAVHVGLRLEL